MLLVTTACAFGKSHASWWGQGRGTEEPAHQAILIPITVSPQLLMAGWVEWRLPRSPRPVY